jgi:uncharacterized protein (TIGR00297 family)
MVLGFALALVISVIARRARSLSTGGAVAATVIGTIAVSAGWSWGALLIIYFVSSSLLSRFGRVRKQKRTESILEKGGERDAVQVSANGAMFAGAALAMIVRPDVRWIALGIGSLAASAADTWATEIGTLSTKEPRSLTTWRRVPAGTSGAVSAPGTLAMIAGALFIGAASYALGWTLEIAGRVVIAGIFGALVDSVLGATVQARRWCETCSRETERVTHDCGTPTRHLRGVPWLDNDIVNFLSNAAAGLFAALM